MIDQFTGDYRFLSNFYPSPIVYEGLDYRTVEHAYQAAKTDDHQLRRIFSLDYRFPATAKRAGRHLPLREDWDSIKVSIMFALLRLKFAPNTTLASQLLSTTGQVLVEGNWHGDGYWGVDWKTRIGENWLGRLLMLRRAELHYDSLRH